MMSKLIRFLLLFTYYYYKEFLNRVGSRYLRFAICSLLSTLFLFWCKGLRLFANYLSAKWAIVLLLLYYKIKYIIDFKDAEIQ